MNKNLLVTRLKALMETNQESLTATADSGRLGRSKHIVRNYAGIERDSSGNAVIHYTTNSQSKPGKQYQCYVTIIPQGNATLYTLAHGKQSVRAKMDVIKNADVKCFCTCPDFNWSGARYNSGHRYDSLASGYQSDDGVPDGSNIPGRNKTIGVCKHLISTFNGIKWQATKIMADVKKAKYQPTEQETKDINDMLEREQSAKKTNRRQSKPKNLLVEKTDASSNTNAQALNILEHSEPKRVPEAEDALNALANTLEKPDITDQTQPAEPVLTDTVDEETDSNETSGLLDHPEPAEPKPNHMADIEEEAELPIFNVPLDDD